jgi:type I restriction enzyme, R subunit
MREALKPFHNPKLRNTILAARDSFQVIDESTKDSVLRAGFDVTALEKARAMLTSFRQFIEDHKDEIEALKVRASNMIMCSHSRA